MPPRKSKASQAPLIQIAADVDLIRFERNLLNIGFFGAHDTRKQKGSTRRIEQIVSRDGQRIKVTAEFRASDLLGLPSTADRDKFLAFMKIAGEQRARTGRISNPIRFSGYRLLRELGISDSGENYEEISRWGKRMADTTITSEKVIYLATRKKYADKTVHVFRSFTRVGQSGPNGESRSETYEVELEDWLLENLNHSYVIPEDFSAYKQLKRPTAKGIFGNLHIWFHASKGQPVEKDYLELCALLNVTPYAHLSKIKDTMGRSLDELITVRYLSQWDIQPMSTKKGYKLILWPGNELMRVLAISQKKQQALAAAEPAILSPQRQEAIDGLIRVGLLPAKASELVERFDSETILDQIEYLESLLVNDKRGRIENPPGFLIYMVENALPVPSDFVTSRKKKVLDLQLQRAEEDRQRQVSEQVHYVKWCTQMLEAELNARFPGEALQQKAREIVTQRKKTDPFLSRVPVGQREDIALQILKKELKEELQLPSFEEWRESRNQIELFSDLPLLEI